MVPAVAGRPRSGRNIPPPSHMLMFQSEHWTGAWQGRRKKKTTEKGKKKKGEKRRKNQLLRAALGNPAGRRVESTAEPVLCPAALTPPRGHGPQPAGWGVAVDTNHRPFCARFATGRLATDWPCPWPHIPPPAQAAQGLLPGSGPWAAGAWCCRWSRWTPGSRAAPGGTEPEPGGGWESGQGCRAPRVGPGVGGKALWEAGTPLCRRAGMTRTLGSHPGPPSVPSA